MLKEKQFPKLLLQNRIIAKETENRKLLEQACKELRVIRRTAERVTGEIRSEDAFRRYLGTAMELGLVQELSGRLYNTKRGEILSALSKNGNPFKLNLAQSYLLLKILLDKDHDYLSSVIRCSIKNGANEYKTFFDIVTKVWHQKLEKVNFKNIKAYDALKIAINTKWKEPQSYYRENIRGPRLEWLSDLKAIEFWNIKKNRVIFRKNIDILLGDKNFSYSFITYMKSLIKGSVTYWKEIPWQKRNKLVARILKQSFNVFKISDAFPKISADQLLEYGLSILSESGIVCEVDELDDAVKLFMQSNLDRYRYVTIISDADRGYISEL